MTRKLRDPAERFWEKVTPRALMHALVPVEAPRTATAAPAERQISSVLMHPSMRNTDSSEAGRWLTQLALDEMVDLSRRGRVDDAIDVAFRTVRQLISGKRFLELDAVLARCDFRRLEAPVGAALLMATHTLRDRLLERREAVRRFERRLWRQYSRQEIEQILKHVR